jgi:hypothetical protein
MWPAAAWRKERHVPVAEITRSECIERARLLRVRHYDIMLDLARGPEVFAVLPEIWASRGGTIKLPLGRVLFPYSAASPELLSQIDDFLAAQDRDPGLARTVIEGRDAVAKALRARSLPG